ncbi:T9SS type A sorting domain-containing protein [Taibaiella soli]|nr:T9SS type A sorting domain-containing protein [Taibaiella soli]
MRFGILAFVFSLIVSSVTFAGKKMKVLFIGNSYTYVNNLPQVTADIAASMGDTLVFDSYTPGGYTLDQHNNDPLCLQKINSAEWDYVILQEQSLGAAEDPSNFFVGSYYAARGLDQKIAANDSCTKVLFYMTWGYKNGEPSFCGTSWPYPCTYEGMDSLVNLRYRAYADSAVMAVMGYSAATVGGFVPVRQAEVSPVGAVRHYIRHQYPSIELYQTDGSHPTEAGTYAAGCTFYAALFHKDPALIPYNYTLSAADAGNIRNAANLVAYDSMPQWHWNIGLHADFNYTVGVGDTLSFSNTSTAAVAGVWDFGDGGMSMSWNTTHVYATGGIYIVRLIAFSLSCADTTYVTINTNPTAVENIGGVHPMFAIYPNPANDMVNVHAVKPYSGSYQVSIANTLGQRVYLNEHATNDQQINISNFAPGIYFIKVKTNDNIVREFKLLKQ